MNKIKQFFKRVSFPGILLGAFLGTGLSFCGQEINILKLLIVFTLTVIGATIIIAIITKD